MAARQSLSLGQSPCTCTYAGDVSDTLRRIVYITYGVVVDVGTA